MFFNRIIKREDKENKRLVEGAQKKLKLSFDHSSEFQKAFGSCIDSVIDKFCTITLNNLLDSSDIDCLSPYKKDLHNEISKAVLLSTPCGYSSFFCDIMGEMLLGLLYYDPLYDTTPDEELRKKLFVEVKRPSKISENICKHYPARVIVSESKNEYREQTSVLGFVNTILDGCLDYHHIMSAPVNLFLFDVKDIKIGGKLKSFKKYSFSSIKPLFDAFTNTPPENQYLFEKTIGFHYACTLTNILENYTCYDDISRFESLIKNSTQLHAIFLRSKITEILLSVLVNNTPYINTDQKEALNAFTLSLFKELEKLYEDILALYWVNEYSNYTSYDIQAREERIHSLGLFLEQFFKDPYTYNAPIDRVYSELIREAGLFDLRYNNCIRDCFIAEGQPEQIEAISGKVIFESLPASNGSNVNMPFYFYKNALGQKIHKEAICSINQKLLERAYSTEDIYKEYNEIIKKLYTDNVEVMHYIQWQERKDIKLGSKVKFTKKHIFAWIQSVVTNCQLE